MLTALEAPSADPLPISCRRGIFPPADLDEPLSVLASPNQACFVQTRASACKHALANCGRFLLLDLGRREIWSGSGDDIRTTALDYLDGIHKLGTRNSQGIDLVLAHALRPDRSIRTSVGVGEWIFRERAGGEPATGDVGWSVSSVIQIVNSIARAAGYPFLLGRVKLGHTEYRVLRREEMRYLTFLVKSPECDIRWPPPVVMNWADNEFTNAVVRMRSSVLDRTGED